MSKDSARREIDESISLCYFCMRCLGLSFHKPKTLLSYSLQNITLLFYGVCILYHFLAETYHIIYFISSENLQIVVPLLYPFGYSFIGSIKYFVIWYKSHIFEHMFTELTGIWPVAPLDEEAQNVKDTKLSMLRTFHNWYFSTTILTLFIYNLSPFIIYFYQWMKGTKEPSLGFIWDVIYPFDKYQPFAHAAVYFYEVILGQCMALVMVCSDLLFSAMASHISLLLCLLQKRLEMLGATRQTQNQYYQELVNIVKTHQRLLAYSSDLENVFSASNLVSIVFSSLNLCSVLFVIVLLEPFFSLSNKLFLVVVLTHTGMLCWYSEELFLKNSEVATAAYNSRWYVTDSRCRRILLFLIQRSQKSVALTAMGFTKLSMVTYTSILTRSYSFFTLLYTVYKNNQPMTENI